MGQQQLRRQLLAGVVLLCLAVSVASRDFYDLLNVPKHATDQQIKRAYRKLALKYHPGALQLLLCRPAVVGVGGVRARAPHASVRATHAAALSAHLLADKVTGTEQEKEEAAKHFAEINHAYETLSDTEKRQIYDQYGEEGLRQHAGQQVRLVGWLCGWLAEIVRDNWRCFSALDWQQQHVGS